MTCLGTQGLGRLCAWAYCIKSTTRHMKAPTGPAMRPSIETASKTYTDSNFL